MLDYEDPLAEDFRTTSDWNFVGDTDNRDDFLIVEQDYTAIDQEYIKFELQNLNPMLSRQNRELIEQSGME